MVYRLPVPLMYNYQCIVEDAIIYPEVRTCHQSMRNQI